MCIIDAIRISNEIDTAEVDKGGMPFKWTRQHIYLIEESIRHFQ